MIKEKIEFSSADFLVVFPGSRKGRAQQVTLLQPASGSAAASTASVTHVKRGADSSRVAATFTAKTRRLLRDLNGSIHGSDGFFPSNMGVSENG